MNVGVQITHWDNFVSFANIPREPWLVWLSGYRVLALRMKGPGFNSDQGHVPGLQDHPQAECGRQPINVLFFCSTFHSLTSALPQTTSQEHLGGECGQNRRQ